jgi:uncharacterized protein YigA (DUF484 family)
METQKKKDNPAALVVDYLKAHPDFFREYPDLLRSLDVPHLAGAGVASLIERQVASLKAHCAQLELELSQKKTRAGMQREMLQNVHALTLKLLRCEDVGSAYAAILSCLRRDYAVDELRMFVFSDAAEPAQLGGIKFMPRTAKLKYMFIELINRNKPLCGSLQDEHIRMLFQGAAGHVSSTLIIPLRHATWEGLVAIGSHERGRYGRGFELDMLQHLFAVVGARFAHFIDQAAA